MTAYKILMCYDIKIASHCRMFCACDCSLTLLVCILEEFGSISAWTEITLRFSWFSLFPSSDCLEINYTEVSWFSSLPSSDCLDIDYTEVSWFSSFPSSDCLDMNYTEVSWFSSLRSSDCRDINYTEVS
jgi:hypothetical protein